MKVNNNVVEDLDYQEIIINKDRVLTGPHQPPPV
jgi:hypothetical protein